MESQEAVTQEAEMDEESHNVLLTTTALHVSQARKETSGHKAMTELKAF